MYKEKVSKALENPEENLREEKVPNSRTTINGVNIECNLLDNNSYNLEIRSEKTE